MKLVVGGKLTEELCKISNFSEWLNEALISGTAKSFPDSVISKEENELKGLKCKSNDVHVLALARASGARLLYSHDNALGKDFKNSDLIPTKVHKRGKVYRTDRSDLFVDSQRTPQCLLSNLNTPPKFLY